ncbi:MAG TPA: DUF6141 family protein [Acidimicrobiia bacterium]|nr:DUF6141 family protein [Acidimicrobiia bacterium]
MAGPELPDFEEVQRFLHPGVWALVAIPVGFAWLAAVWQVALGNRFGSSPAPDWVLVLVWVLAGVLLPSWLVALRLVTRVDGSGVDVRFHPPLSGRGFPFEDIERCEQVRYLPIREFSGWGIRWGRRGDVAVEITLRQGYRFTVGSQRPDALEEAILARLGSQD